MNVQERIYAGYYDKPSTNELFRQEVLEELGLKDHPKADTFIFMAWDRAKRHGGRADSLLEILQEAYWLYELLS